MIDPRNIEISELFSLILLFNLLSTLNFESWCMDFEKMSQVSSSSSVNKNNEPIFNIRLPTNSDMSKLSTVHLFSWTGLISCAVDRNILVPSVKAEEKALIATVNCSDTPGEMDC